MVSVDIDYMVYDGITYYPDENGMFRLNVVIPEDAQVTFVGKIDPRTCFECTSIGIVSQEDQRLYF